MAQQTVQQSQSPPTITATARATSFKSNPKFNSKVKITGQHPKPPALRHHQKASPTTYQFNTPTQSRRRPNNSHLLTTISQVQGIILQSPLKRTIHLQKAPRIFQAIITPTPPLILYQLMSPSASISTNTTIRTATTAATMNPTTKQPVIITTTTTATATATTSRLKFRIITALLVALLIIRQ